MCIDLRFLRNIIQIMSKQESFLNRQMSRRDFVHDGALIIVGTGFGVLAGVELAKNEGDKYIIETNLNVAPTQHPKATGEQGVSPEERRQASLQIFKDIVRNFVNTDHDYNFWSTLDDFMGTAPQDELQKQIEGDISGPDGVLDVLWPKDVPINKHDPPIIRLALHQNIGNARSSDTRLEMRLTPEGKINTFREASGKSETIMRKPEEMKSLLVNVFKIDELKTYEGWVINYGMKGDSVVVAKTIHGNNETITVAMNDYGYAFLTIENTYPGPLSPTPKPTNEA